MGGGHEAGGAGAEDEGFDFHGPEVDRGGAQSKGVFLKKAALNPRPALQFAIVSALRFPGCWRQAGRRARNPGRVIRGPESGFDIKQCGSQAWRAMFTDDLESTIKAACD